MGGHTLGEAGRGDVQGAGPPPPAAAIIQASGVLTELLAGAGVQGERAVAAARLAVCLLSLVRHILTGGWSRLVVGDPSHCMIVGALCLGVAVSVFSLVRLRPGSDSRRPLLAASVATDAVVIFLVLLPHVLWPPASYVGVLNMPQISVVLLAIVAAGARLSVSVAGFGCIACMLLTAVLVALDGWLQADRLTYGAGETVLFFVLLLGSAVLSVGIARRTRRLVYQGATAILQAERARQRFGTYVSEEVADQALTQDELRLGGERRPVAVLFSDLRNFTGYAEGLAPERLVLELNAYLNAMVAVIREHGGLVDKYIGDAIMVVFGVPEARADSAARAIRTARAMVKALKAHNRQRRTGGMRPLRQGIGIHFGTAIAGNVGTQERMQYTVLGDVVNLASRLESATKEQNVQVLVSSEALEAARECPGDGKVPPMRRVGDITVRGHEEPIEVHTFE